MLCFAKEVCHIGFEKMRKGGQQEDVGTQRGRQATYFSMMKPLTDRTLLQPTCGRSPQRRISSLIKRKHSAHLRVLNMEIGETDGVFQIHQTLNNFVLSFGTSHLRAYDESLMFVANCGGWHISHRHLLSDGFPYRLWMLRVALKRSPQRSRVHLLALRPAMYVKDTKHLPYTLMDTVHGNGEGAAERSATATDDGDGATLHGDRRRAMWRWRRRSPRSGAFRSRWWSTSSSTFVGKNHGFC